MLTEGIIRLSNNPYFSLVLLVKIKDGSWRFCVDYQALNIITIRNHFPILTVDELFNELTGATIFSKLDLCAGYHQIQIHLLDIENMVFHTHDDHFGFIVMAFGLSNTPSSFQVVMNSIFWGVLWCYVLAFFNDILVYSPTWDSHLEHLRTVLTLLHTHCLFAKLTKCAFGYIEITYLGYRISGQGLMVDQDKIEVISAWPLPTLVKNLRASLGHVEYYRCFILHYLALIVPLIILLRKDTFVWSLKAPTTFYQVKEAFTKTPLLVLPDLEDLFIIQIDDITGIRAIL